MRSTTTLQPSGRPSAARWADELSVAVRFDGRPVIELQTGITPASARPATPVAERPVILVRTRPAVTVVEPLARPVIAMRRPDGRY